MTDYIQSVSMPRSGHHFLVKLLRAYYNDKDRGIRRMRYCEYYNCCSTRPCKLWATEENPCVDVLIQKSHDEYLRRADVHFEPPVRVSSAGKHIIQFRNPLHSTISDFRLEQEQLHAECEKATDKFSQTCDLTPEDRWVHFAERQLDYRTRFLKKWVLENPLLDSEHYYPLNYETLLTRPLDTLAEVLRFAKPNEQVSLNRVKAAFVKRPVKKMRNPLDFEFASTLGRLELICSEIWSECIEKLDC